jgi:polar amino acid transport system permease protein
LIVGGRRKEIHIFRIFTVREHEKASSVKAAFNYLIVSVLLIGFVLLSLNRVGVALDFSFLADFSKRLGDGFWLTVALSLASLACSLLIGIACAAGQNAKILPVRYLCNIYVNIIRGTPLIMQIYLFFYIIGTAWGVSNRFAAGVIILSIFEGAYITEIIRGSLLSIEASQLEAAKAVGFTRRQTVFCVILPQIVARTLPALTGQFASIIKDSSLLSVIAVTELTQTMREISATNFRLFECYFALGVLYLCLTLPISFVSKWLERKYDYGN